MLRVLLRIALASSAIPFVLPNRPFSDSNYSLLQAELAKKDKHVVQPASEPRKLKNISLLSVNETKSSIEQVSELLDVAKEKMRKGLGESLKKAVEEDKKYQELRDELTKGLDEFSQSAASLQVRMPEEQMKKIKDFGKVAGIADLLEMKQTDASEHGAEVVDNDNVDIKASARKEAQQSSDGQTPEKKTNQSLAQVRRASTKHHAKKTRKSGASKAHTHRMTSKKLHRHRHAHAATAHGKAHRNKVDATHKRKNVHRKLSSHRKTPSRPARVGLIETREQLAHLPNIDAAEAADALG